MHGAAYHILTTTRRSASVTRREVLQGQLGSIARVFNNGDMASAEAGGGVHLARLAWDLREFQPNPVCVNFQTARFRPLTENRFDKLSRLPPLSSRLLPAAQAPHFKCRRHALYLRSSSIVMPGEDARAQRKVPRGDLASVAPANAAAAKEEFLAKKVGCFHARAPPHVALMLHSAQSCVAPRFIYQSSALSRGLALAAFSHSDRYSGAAVHVLRRVLAQFGSWTQWEQHCNAGFLPPDEVDRRVALYLTRLNCQHVISIAWDPNIVAPTMLAGRRLLLRGPYREGRVQSVRTRLPALCRRRSSVWQPLYADVWRQVLDHEIGTHFVRKYNGKLQSPAACPPKQPIQVRLESEEVRRSADPHPCTSHSSHPVRAWQASTRCWRSAT
jgi:hypothetical protein